MTNPIITVSYVNEHRDVIVFHLDNGKKVELPINNETLDALEQIVETERKRLA